MGTTRLVLVAFLVIALMLGLLFPTSRRAIGERIEELRWRARGETAESFCRRAEVNYQLGDFEVALEDCRRAMRLDPRHAPARAFFTELQFILGEGRASPATSEYDEFMRA